MYAYTNKLLFLLLVCILAISCNSIVKFEEKPLIKERGELSIIKFIDNTGYMEKLYGSNAVRGAEVILKSNYWQTEINTLTDDSGLVRISDYLSDQYFISAIRVMREEEMILITGLRIKNHKLVNKKTKIIELRADKKDTLFVEMDLQVGGSPVVISEIYACGPPGAGLYYHDKYIEVFNQSDSIVYLDGIIVAVVYASSYLGQNYVDDTMFVHSKNVWKFPGNGMDYPLMPGEFAVCAEDAIDHRINALNSVDLSHVKFEFFKDDAPDVDNPYVPNMIKIYQPAGNDWLIGGEQGAIVISKIEVDSLIWFGDQILIPHQFILDGVEYLKDQSQLDKKILNHKIDGGGTGGIQFYTGKSMERLNIPGKARLILKDDNNSSLDFIVIDKPTPEFHYSMKSIRK